MKLIFKPNGQVLFISTDRIITLENLGSIKARRASHVWPEAHWRQIGFFIARMIFAEGGRVVRWTRTWKGNWTVRWVGTPWTIRHVSNSRRECIDWEIEKLERRLAVE